VVDERAQLRGWIDLDPSLTGSVEDNLVSFDVQVPLGTSLRAAFGEMLLHDVRWLPVVDGGRYLGVLTPNSLHAAVRRSVGGRPVEPDESEGDPTADVAPPEDDAQPAAG
jgi:osmoprotectant transport system ATP-binding protein